MPMRHGSPPPPREEARDDVRDDRIEMEHVPTPQTTRQHRISRADRFWWFVYNDPKGQLILWSAIIGTLYMIFKVVDAAILYSRIQGLVAAMAPEARQLVSASSLFLQELPVVHYVTIILAVVFNWLAYFAKRPLFAVIAVVCYLVCGISYIRWIIFVLPELVLLVVGYMALVRRRGAWI